MPLAVEVEHEHAVAALREAVGVGGRDARLAGAALEVEEELDARRERNDLAPQLLAEARQIVGREAVPPPERTLHLLRGRADDLGEALGGVADVLHEDL